MSVNLEKIDSYISRKDIHKYFKNNDVDNRLINKIDNHNKDFINKKLIEYKAYFDNLFKGIDDNITLDLEQRVAVLTDEDYNMVIAGAGSGKTTTMAAKVKYLVEIKNIDPNDIILISYTNKAVDELKLRINKQFNIPVDVCTFHKFGMDILKRNNKNIRVLNDSYKILKNYFNEIILNDNEVLKQFIDFFAYYFDIPSIALNFKSLNNYDSFKNKIILLFKRLVNNYNSKTISKYNLNNYSINGEFLDSLEEARIANYLYLNGIDYSYKTYAKDIKYIPRFTIYQENLIIYIDFYDKNINNLELLKLDNASLLDDLKNILLKYGFVLKPRNYKDVYIKLVNNSKDNYYSRFIYFCIDFIGKFKINGYTKDYFKLLKSNIDNRTLMFLDFIQDVYDYYQSYMEKNKYIDFEDMINMAYHELSNKNITLNYKYIIIDEYQDISMQRFNLAKKISEVSDAKIIAVGDDWQAIFSFSGSDISLFTSFKKLMGYAEELRITNTYRNSQELIDIAGHFVMMNNYQIKKKLKSPKRLKYPIFIVYYNDKNNKLKNKTFTINSCLKDTKKRYGDGQKILLIGRYNFEKNYLLKSKYFYETIDKKIKSTIYPKLDITFLSAHSSKGLGFDQVIILNGEDALYGFPSKIVDDPIMNLVRKKDETFLFSEERRLFYVALTRTKNRVYIIAPKNNLSIFLIELMHYKDVKFIKNRHMI